jgi:HSP20 family protein
VSPTGQDPILIQLRTMKSRMDALYSESFMQESSPQATQAPSDAETWQPQLDIWETEKEWVILADLPGVKDEDLQVEVEENQLIIRGKRETKGFPDGCRASLIERSQGCFYRLFTLPDDSRQDGIQAELKQGVLTVSIPRNRIHSMSSQRIWVQSK